MSNWVFVPLDGQSSMVLVQGPMGPKLSTPRSDRWERGVEFWRRSSLPDLTPDCLVVPVTCWPRLSAQAYSIVVED